MFEADNYNLMDKPPSLSATCAGDPLPIGKREWSAVGISHSGTLSYQYAYGADGNRRWSKDIGNDVWTWYPCGVACGAGEMVEETSSLTGSSWSVSSQYLRAGGGCSNLLIRRKSSTDDEYHHENLQENYAIITDSAHNIKADIIFDNFNISRYSTNNTLTQYYKSNWVNSDDTIQAETISFCRVIPMRALMVTCAIKIGPIYGRCCGPQTYTPKIPIKDAVDGCCCNHDKCYSVHKCGIINRIWKPACKACDKTLCACLNKAKCYTFACNIARITIEGIMC